MLTVHCHYEDVRSGVRVQCHFLARGQERQVGLLVGKAERARRGKASVPTENGRAGDTQPGRRRREWHASVLLAWKDPAGIL